MNVFEQGPRVHKWWRGEETEKSSEPCSMCMVKSKYIIINKLEIYNMADEDLFRHASKLAKGNEQQLHWTSKMKS